MWGDFVEKVKVSMEVFEAFQNSRRDIDDVIWRELMVKNFVRRHFFEYCRPLLSLEHDTFMKCLYFGYELEETKEQKLLRHYENCEVNDYRNGIRHALDVLNISIKGITEF